MFMLTADRRKQEPNKQHAPAVPVGSAPEGGPDSGAGKLLDIAVNRRLRNSWRVRADSKTGRRLLSIPQILADAPQDVKDCLVKWAMLPLTRKARRSPAVLNDKRLWESAVRAYMESKGVTGVRASRADPAVFESQTRGGVYNLRDIFNAVNAAYFDNRIASCLRWGRCDSRTSYCAVKYDREGNPFNLITISGVYDSPKVPEYAIYGLMYHEMLHIAIPPRTVNGRRVVHGRDFKAAERKYPFYGKWAAWEKENLAKLLASARRRRRRAI